MEAGSGGSGGSGGTSGSGYMFLPGVDMPVYYSETANGDRVYRSETVMYVNAVIASSTSPDGSSDPQAVRQSDPTVPTSFWKPDPANNSTGSSITLDLDDSDIWVSSVRLSFKTDHPGLNPRVRTSLDFDFFGTQVGGTWTASKSMSASIPSVDVGMSDSLCVFDTPEKARYVQITFDGPWDAAATSGPEIDRVVVMAIDF